MGKNIVHTKKYNAAKSAKVGEVVKCACCGKEFVKRYYQEAFCCPKCKDDYWNAKGDRHKKGKSYYRQYNLEHPERLSNTSYEYDDEDLYDDVLADMRDEDFDYCDW
jgi:ribosomal protein L37AE/L43A